MKKQKQQIIDYIVSNHEKIDVEGGKCRWNYMCHMNSVHEAVENNDDKLAMCVYIDDDYPIVHFVNIHDDKYVDNTLGQWSSQYNYYLIRTISKDEFFDIMDIFRKYRSYLRTVPSWWLTIFRKYDA